jgi:hypothetical protein
LNSAEGNFSLPFPAGVTRLIDRIGSRRRPPEVDPPARDPGTMSGIVWSTRFLLPLMNSYLS